MRKYDTNAMIGSLQRLLNKDGPASSEIKLELTNGFLNEISKQKQTTAFFSRKKKTCDIAFINKKTSVYRYYRKKVFSKRLKQ